MSIQFNLVSGATEESVSVVYPGGTLVAQDDHPSFSELREIALDMILNESAVDEDYVLDLFNVGRTIERKFEQLTERVSVRGERLYFDGDPVHNSLSEAALRALSEGVDDWKALVNFYEKVQTNPEAHSRDQLYTWLDSRPFSITPDGDIVMYKGVSNDLSPSHGLGIGYYIDGVKATPDNKAYAVNTVVTMPRSSVVHDPGNACSAGLHCADYDYANGWGSTVIRIIVNPRDVVSVPTHDNLNKVRACRFKVDAIVKEGHQSFLYDPQADYDYEYDPYEEGDAEKEYDY